jgi:hypothetical protein
MTRFEILVSLRNQNCKLNFTIPARPASLVVHHRSRSRSYIYGDLSFSISIYIKVLLLFFYISIYGHIRTDFVVFNLWLSGWSKFTNSVWQRSLSEKYSGV